MVSSYTKLYDSGMPAICLALVLLHGYCIICKETRFENHRERLCEYRCGTRRENAAESSLGASRSVCGSQGLSDKLTDNRGLRQWFR